MLLNSITKIAIISLGIVFFQCGSTLNDKSKHSKI